MTDTGLRECVVCGCVHLSDELNLKDKEIERLQQSSVESQILASKWMEAHDCLKAGLSYHYPSPADKSDLDKEIERLLANEEKLMLQIERAFEIERERCDGMLAESADEIERLKRENASLADMVALLGDAATISKAAF